MIRNWFVIGVMAWVCSACSSSDASNNGGSAGGSDNAGGSSAVDNGCPDVSGAWTITDHCEAAYIGMTLNVNESSCVLSFASPFDVFSGSVTTNGKIMLSGPQSCTGTASATAISMSCTPDPCPVKLSR